MQTSAQNSGLPCSGSEMQAESCNDQECPGRLAINQFICRLTIQSFRIPI